MLKLLKDKYKIWWRNADHEDQFVKIVILSKICTFLAFIPIYLCSLEFSQMTSAIFTENVRLW